LKHSKWSRAQSPLPQMYADMPPKELERILGTGIPRAPSWTDRARSYLGFETNPPYDPTALRSARRAAHSRDSRKAKLKEQYEDKMRESAAAEKRADDAREAAKEAAIRHKLEIQRLQDAAEAARRAKSTQKLITQEDIDAAQKNYNDLRWDAQRSATTNSFVPEGSDYVTLSRARDAALGRLNELQKKFAKQERNKGGKSKRVKSKRNKRSTKRRNARK
jgi:hypothetical protein